MAVIPDTSEVSERGHSCTRERIDLLRTWHFDLRYRVRTDRQTNSVSSLERNCRGQERRARDSNRRAVDRHVHHHRGRGALGDHRTFPICLPDRGLRANL